MRNRMKLNWTSAAALLVLVAVVGLLTVSGPALAEKGGNGKPGGGGGGGEGTPEEFGCIEFLDAPGDGIQSDGLLEAAENDPYDYCHQGRPLVVVLTNDFIFKVKTRAKRQLHMDLSLMGFIDADGDLTETPFQFPPGSMFQGNTAHTDFAELVINRVPNVGSVDQQALWRSLDDPTTAADDEPGKLTYVEVGGTFIYGQAGKEEWYLYFGVHFKEPTRSDPLIVTRIGPDTWTIKPKGLAAIEGDYRAIGLVDFTIIYDAKAQ